MYCIKCGKEIDEGSEYCYFCGEKQTKEDAPKKSNPSIKNFILTWGRKLVDFETCIGILIAVLLMLACWFLAFGCMSPDKYGYMESIGSTPWFILLSVLLPILVLIIVIIFKYFIYLFIDIRDTLHEINDKLKKEDK